MRSVLLFLVLVIAGVVGLAVGVVYSLRPECLNDVIAEVTSPDGARKAVLFRRNCGAMTDFSTQVKLLDADEELGSEYGDVFYASGDGDPGPRAPWGSPWADMRWEDDATLVVRYEQWAWPRMALPQSEVDGLTFRHEALDLIGTAEGLRERPVPGQVWVRLTRPASPPEQDGR